MPRWWRKLFCITANYADPKVSITNKTNMNTPETDALTLAMVGKDDAEHLLALVRLSCRLERERDKARQEAQDFRDGMSIHLTEGPAEFSWEGTKL